MFQPERLGQTLAHSEKLGRAFDQSAEYWRGYYEAEPGGAEPVGAERLRIFGEALTTVRARGLWLDAGCGIGVMAQHLRSGGVRICGIDMSAGLLAEAQRLTGLPLVADDSAPEEHLRRASVARLPYAPEHFEGAYSSSVLEYVANLDLALAELNRVVRRGGYLIFNLPNAFSVFRIRHAIQYRRDPYYELVPRWAYWTWEVTAMLRSAGWLPERITFYGAEHNAPVVPQFVPERLRQRLSRSPLAASFVLFVARKP